MESIIINLCCLWKICHFKFYKMYLVMSAACDDTEDALDLTKGVPMIASLCLALPANVLQNSPGDLDLLLGLLHLLISYCSIVMPICHIQRDIV